MPLLGVEASQPLGTRDQPLVALSQQARRECLQRLAGAGRVVLLADPAREVEEDAAIGCRAERRAGPRARLGARERGALAQALRRRGGREAAHEARKRLVG